MQARIRNFVYLLLLVRHDRPRAVESFRFFFFRLSESYLKTSSKTSWTGYQPVARPLPTQDNKNTEETRIYIYAPSGIRTHDPNIRPVDRSLCDRNLSYVAFDLHRRSQHVVSAFITHEIFVNRKGLTNCLHYERFETYTFFSLYRYMKHLHIGRDNNMNVTKLSGKVGQSSPTGC
jgi:hypothetical protein